MANTRYAENETAPWTIIPETEITSIEHPCIVKNKYKAIDMLGGPQALTQSLEQGTRQTLALTFRPDEPASRSILSLHNDTNNVLLKVTVPKRTGRKRKRGSNGDFVEDTTDLSTIPSAASLVSGLKHNPERSSIEAVGNIKSCHIWRAIPDFAYYSKTSSFLRNIETQILPQQYPLLKQWSLPRTYGLQDTEIIPPAVLSTQSMSQNYTYRQNPAVKTYADPMTGDKVLLNRAAPLRLHIQVVMFDDTSYPTTISPDCPPLEEQSPALQKLVVLLRERFDKRPIWIKRALFNSLPSTASDYMARVAAAYVCYSVRSGPWRDAYVRLGLDPRTDPKYRKYQTLLLKLMPKDKATLLERRQLQQRLWVRNTDTESHIFTGTQAVGIDGKTWQLCDLQDPVLKQLVDVPDLHIRAECETRYFGWYQNGTSAKLRVLLKAKIDALAEGGQVNSDIVQAFIQLPEHWIPKARPKGSSEIFSGYLPDGASNMALEWAAAYRSICRTAGGTLPRSGGSGKGRLSKPKPKTRPSYIGSEVESDGEQDAEAEDEDEDIGEDAEAAADYEEPEDGEEDLAVEGEEEEAETAVQ